MKFLLVLGLLLGAGWYFLKPLPPGKGPEADKGRRMAAPIITAVETYRSSRGSYPLSLDDMVPDVLAGVPHLPNGSTFEYKFLAGGYKLTFNYTNPLPVHCSYEPASNWVCEWF